MLRGGLLAGMALIGRRALPVPAICRSRRRRLRWLLPLTGAGIYVGGHIGYTTGTSDWSASSTGATAPLLNGMVNFFNSFDAFKGTGSYFEGFQAGYDYMSPSRFLFGVEADASFPNTVGGTATLASPVAGLASYSEQVEYSTTLRGRIGYAPNLGVSSHWLFYATGGLAWTFDQFTRTQLAGGAAAAGTVENLYMVPRRRRHGWRRHRIRPAVELDGAARISVLRLRQSQCHLSGRRAAFQFQALAQRIALRAELPAQRRRREVGR